MAGDNLSDSDTPPEVTEAATAAVSSLLPAKSRLQYEKTYNEFRKWCATKNVVKVSEKVLLAYLEERSTKVRPPTLWSAFSMLKATLNVKENIDLRTFPKLVPYLKSKSVGYRGKKSKILTREDVVKFIKDADDESHLLKKVQASPSYVFIPNNILLQTVLILGISGACRREELVKMTIDDVEDVGSILIVKVPDSKNHSERTFTVTNLEYVRIYRKYRALRPRHASSRRLFLKYTNGKCVNQHVGINKIGEMPSLIAKWLGKDMCDRYTGHCFRRSSATLLANAGGNMTSLKRHGGWKSSTVAESYIEDSLSNKIDISNKILNSQPSTSTEDMPDKNCDSQPVTSREIRDACQDIFDYRPSGMSSSGINVGNNCSNFTINLYLNNK